MESRYNSNLICSVTNQEIMMISRNREIQVHSIVIQTPNLRAKYRNLLLLHLHHQVHHQIITLIRVKTMRFSLMLEEEVERR